MFFNLDSDISNLFLKTEHYLFLALYESLIQGNIKYLHAGPGCDDPRSASIQECPNVQKLASLVIIHDIHEFISLHEFRT